MSEFRMPSLGADMDFGTLVEWRVKRGDQVKRGDIIAEVETEKGVIEVEVFEAGVVEELLVQPPARVRVGAVLARLGDGVERPATPEPPVPAPGVTAPGVTAPAVPQPAIPAPSAPAPRAVRASPLARRVAEALGVDLERITGTGEEGAITRADVEAAAARGAAPVVPVVPVVPSAPPTAAPRAPEGAAAAMRQAIAAAVTRAHREIPHYYLAAEISLRRATAWLAERNAPRPPAERLVPAALLLKAAALALRDTPELNGFWVDGAPRPSAAIHLGVAISLRAGGLVAPAIHDADRLSVDELMRALRDLVQRARTGGLRGSELTDPTITVTNLGDRGVESVFGIIYPPQVALVGFGRIRERPWAEGGMLGAHPTVVATLAGDHRASDGHRGGLYLSAVDRLLQHPEAL